MDFKSSPEDRIEKCIEDFESEGFEIKDSSSGRFKVDIQESLENRGLDKVLLKELAREIANEHKLNFKKSEEEIIITTNVDNTTVA